MAIIHILDEHAANQIAAGEVVERPSSVVKELVENAVDAGSTTIDVAVEEGGLQLIRVTDNGSGMDPEDCERAFYRHATSKISDASDLFSIRTLGFRGEALPSIAAVSRTELTSCPNDSGLGCRMVVHGGDLKERTHVAAPRGTDIAVKDLFYNTPARLKYMKTIQTELGHITDYIYRLSLSHPEIAFTLKHNGHLLLQTLGNSDLRQTAAAIYGTAAAKGLLEIQAESLDYRLRGMIGKPELTRSNRGAVSTIINGRYIRNYALIQAIMQGYHTLLPVHRYPYAILHIDMDPELVDVNVHPSKLEVRFSKEPELLQFIEQQVRQVLSRVVLIPGAPMMKPKQEAVIQEQMTLYRPGGEPSKQETEGLGGRLLPVNNLHPAPEQPGQQLSRLNREAAPWNRPDTSALQTSGAAPSKPVRPQNASYASEQRTDPEAAEALLRSLSETAAQPAPELPGFPVLHPIGQLHGTYIVAQNEEGLFLIDQHAAHERINYEYYYELFGRPAEASQELLIPITLEYTASEASRLTDKLPQLEQAGVHLEHFGGQTFVVRAYPHWLPQGEEKDWIEEMIEWLLTEKKHVDVAKLREKAAIMCSCKASIKANQNISNLEIEALLDRLAACRNPYTCPHGRPIVVSFSTYELEKMFKRVM